MSGESGWPRKARFPCLEVLRMTWTLLFGAVAVFVLFPALAFFVTMKLQKKS